ncbi:MAG: carbohydrate kinase [Bacteroidales bacterium]|nr:carbohydrate kinase [Bacteroidales bacterium]
MNDNRVVVGIGEALWDVLPDGKKIGGAPANFAYHVSQLGLPGIAVSAIGHDRLGEELKGQFDKRGLTTQLPAVDYPTGTVLVEVDELGIPSYDIKENVAWDNIPFTPELEQLAARTRAVSFGSLAQRNVVSRDTIHKFLDAMPSDNDTLKIFDINLRQGFYTPELIEESLERCNILKINDEELVLISRLFGYPGIDLMDKCRLLLEKYNLRILILTCGVNGSYVFTPGSMSFIETPEVEVADTVGAGDSFTAAFTAALLRGLPVSEAHRRAVDVSAYVCTQHGAMPVLPESLTQ